MSFKERLKKWAAELAEETAAEAVTEIAIDKLPPVFIMSIVSYVSIAAAIAFGFAGWYWGHLVVLCYVLAAFFGFVGVVLYLIRSYVVSKLSQILLKGYRHVKDNTKSRLSGEDETKDDEKS